MLKSGESFVNPWSTSTVTNLLQKIKAKLSKYKVRDINYLSLIPFIINNAKFSTFFCYI